MQALIEDAWARGFDEAGADVCVCECVCESVCACVCVWERERAERERVIEDAWVRGFDEAGVEQLWRQAAFDVYIYTFIYV